jgi:hypothetical protein
VGRTPFEFDSTEEFLTDSALEVYRALFPRLVITICRSVNHKNMRLICASMRLLRF